MLHEQAGSKWPDYAAHRECCRKKSHESIEPSLAALQVRAELNQSYTIDTRSDSVQALQINQCGRSAKRSVLSNCAKPAEGIVGFGPISELIFDGRSYALQEAEVAIVETQTAREFPDPFNGIQIRAVRR
jgi:hypothetical protein